MASEDKIQATEPQQGTHSRTQARLRSNPAIKPTRRTTGRRRKSPIRPRKEARPRTSVQKPEKYRFAANIPADKTVAEQEYADYVLDYSDSSAGDQTIPDVLLDVPVVKVDEINFELNDLRAKVSLYAKVLDLVELSVGVDAYLGRVKLVIQGVEAQALLKVRLDNVTAILDRVLTTIDRNPQIVERLVEGVSSAVEDIGSGAGQLVGEGLNYAVEDIGSGAGQLVGEGLNSAVEDIGSGAGQLVGEGLNYAVEDMVRARETWLAKGSTAVEDIGAGAGFGGRRHWCGRGRPGR